MKKIIVLVMFVMMVVGAVNAQGLSLYAKKQLVVTTDTLNYRELTPKNVKAGQKYPLVVFLHGLGERGSDNEKQLVWGGQMFLNPVNRDKYPAYVVFPQCPDDAYGPFNGMLKTMVPDELPILEEPTKVIKLVRTLVKNYIMQGLVDPDRVYVMGLSLGGMGTFDFACRYPELVAAAVPICGAVNPKRLKAATDVHWRIFHGDADDVVPVEASRAAYEALKSNGADVNYVEFPGCNHGSWNPAFNVPDFMKWIFSKSKNRK